MKNKFWHWSKNEDTGERILRLDGVIHDWSFIDDLLKDDDDDALTTPDEFRKELNSASGNIIIQIHSPGGNTFSAAEIYSMLKEYNGGKITAKIASFAASAATIVAMAADTVEISPLAFMMIHNPWLDSVWGEEKDMLHAAHYLKDLKDNIINIYESKTKLSRQLISDMMDSETYMNSKKAVELHFADTIMFDDSPQVNNYSPELFSTKQATNSLLKRFKHSSMTNDNRVDAKNLIHRLKIIS